MHFSIQPYQNAHIVLFIPHLAIMDTLKTSTGFWTKLFMASNKILPIGTMNFLPHSKIWVFNNPCTMNASSLVKTQTFCPPLLKFLPPPMPNSLFASSLMTLSSSNFSIRWWGRIEASQLYTSKHRESFTSWGWSPNNDAMLKSMRNDLWSSMP